MSAQDDKSPTPKQRLAILRRRRDEKMARSAHAYVRGSTVQFYEWLRETHRRRLPDGPPVWICGDCHVGISVHWRIRRAISTFRSGIWTKPSSATPTTI